MYSLPPQKPPITCVTRQQYAYLTKTCPAQLALINAQLASGHTPLAIYVNRIRQGYPPRWSRRIYLAALHGYLHSN